MNIDKVEAIQVISNREKASQILKRISDNNTRQCEYYDRKRVIHNLSDEESSLLEIMLRDYLDEYI